MDLSWVKGIYVVWFAVGFMVGWSCATAVLYFLIDWRVPRVPRRARPEIPWPGPWAPPRPPEDRRF